MLLTQLVFQDNLHIGLAELQKAGLPRWDHGKEFTCQCRRCKLDLWVRKIPWRRKWQPNPVFLPRESYGQKSLVAHSPWGCKESNTTEHVCTHWKPVHWNSVLSGTQPELETLWHPDLVSAFSTPPRFSPLLKRETFKEKFWETAEREVCMCLKELGIENSLLSGMPIKSLHCVWNANWTGSSAEGFLE